MAAASGLVEEISDSVLRNPGALISLARLKTADDYTYMHSVAVCALMVALGRQIGLNEGQVRTAGLAGLLHDLGKGETPDHVLPRHIGHEAAGVPLVRAVCARYKVPKDYAQLAELVCRLHLDCHRVVELQGKTLWKKLRELDALRRPDRFEDFLAACEADARGRLGLEDRPYPARDYFRQARALAAAISPRDLPNLAHLKGEAIGEALDKARSDALNQLRQDYHDQHARPAAD